MILSKCGKLIFVLALCGTIYSCANDDTGIVVTANPVMIELTPQAKTYSLAGNIDSVRVVNLDTSVKAVISEAWGIQRILTLDNKFFILDGRYMSIKVFDTNGNYLYSIGKLGTGKGDFVKVNDMAYDSYHNSILVLCNSPSKIIEFGLDGTILKDTRLDFYATGVAAESPNSFFFYVNQNFSPVSGKYNVLITDSTFSVKTKMLNRKALVRSSIMFSGGVFPVNGNIYFNPALTRTYYSINNDTLVPQYEVEYGKKDIPPTVKEGELMSNLKNYDFQYNSFVKTKEFVGFNYHGNSVMSALYDIKSGNIMITDLAADSLNSLFSNLMFQKGDSIISVLDLNRLSPFIKRNYLKIKERFPDISSKLKYKETDQNPILLIYKVKSI